MIDQYTTRLGPGIYRVNTTQDPIADSTYNLYTQYTGINTSFFLTFVGTSSTIATKNRVYTNTELSYNPNTNTLAFSTSTFNIKNSFDNTNIVGFGSTEVVFNKKVLINNDLIVQGNLELPGLTVKNIIGGSAGDLVYQFAPGITSFLSPGQIDYVLTSNGPGVVPSWKVSAGVASYVANSGFATYASSSGISSYSSIAGFSTFSNNSGISSFSSSAGLATYSNTSGISTYSYTSGISTYSSVSGLATYSNTSGISTYSNTSGLSTYSSISGLATYSIASGVATFSSSSGISSYSVLAGLSTFSVNSGISSYSSVSGISTNILGGSIGSLVYQFSSGITSFIASGPIDFVLTSNGPETIPSWKAIASSGVVTYSTTSGISSYATISGISTYSTSSGISTYSALSGISSYAILSGISTYSASSEFSTISGISSYSSSAGVATYSTNSGLSTYSTSSGISTNISGGSIGSLVYQFSSGITSFLAPGSLNQLLTSNGPGFPPSYSQLSIVEPIILVISNRGETASASTSYEEVRIPYAFTVTAIRFTCSIDNTGSSSTTFMAYRRTAAGVKTSLLSANATLTSGSSLVDATSLITGSQVGASGERLGIDLIAVGTGCSGIKAEFIITRLAN